MIRDKNKIHGEANAPNTVIAPAKLATNQVVVSIGKGTTDTDLGLTKVGLKSGTKQILYLNETSRADLFSYNQPNKLIGIGSNGKLTRFDRKSLPPTPPSGRVLVAEVYGSNTPSGLLGQTTITLDGYSWYEVEVRGAGGGGGGGAIADWEALKNGRAGGRGGYYKGLFSVLSSRTATLQAGCAGGGGQGRSISKGSGWFPSYSISGTNYGGTGGRTPVIYGGNGETGNDAIYLVTSGQVNEAAEGINGGADSGDSSVTFPGPGAGAVGATGGAANGPLGGKGGTFKATNGATAFVTYGGGSGGAGGGFGIGGNGGGRYLQLIGGVIVSGGRGGTSYGGGGGGVGAGSEASGSNGSQASGGGGGGGGGSRFISGDIHILCGGGGGGRGGGSASTDTSVSIGAGGPGLNNQNADEGMGGAGGLGATGYLWSGWPSPPVGPSPTIPDGQTVSLTGSDGNRGIVRLWKCV